MKEEEGKQEDDDEKKPVKMEEGEGSETVKKEEKEEDKDKDRLEESLYDEELIEGFSFCSFDTFKGLQVGLLVKRTEDPDPGIYISSRIRHSSSGSEHIAIRMQNKHHHRRCFYFRVEEKNVKKKKIGSLLLNRLDRSSSALNI